jgi:uncharacterized cupin superfamily protein
MADDPHIVRTAALDWSKVWRGRHPFNPSSEMRIFPLGDPAGMKRLGVHLMQIPPGKESFIPHNHAMQEEFVFVLSGTGEAVLDGVAHAVGPSDFVGFPTDGVVHSIRATGQDALVYLTGGERTSVEVSDMPTIGKTTLTRDGRVTLLDASGAEEITVEEWMRRARLDD